MKPESMGFLVRYAHVEVERLSYRLSNGLCRQEGHGDVVEQMTKRVADDLRARFIIYQRDVNEHGMCTTYMWNRFCFSARVGNSKYCSYHRELYARIRCGLTKHVRRPEIKDRPCHEVFGDRYSATAFQSINKDSFERIVASSPSQEDEVFEREVTMLLNGLDLSEDEREQVEMVMDGMPVELTNSLKDKLKTVFAGV